MEKQRKPFLTARRGLAIGLSVGIALVPAWAWAEQLPVFKLADPTIDVEHATGILASLYGGKLPHPPEMDEDRGALIQRIDAKEVEIQLASGGLFARDAKQLWNPALTPRLPKHEEAKALADRFVAEHKLLPERSEHLSVSFIGFSETGAAPDVKGAVVSQTLDIQANYAVNMTVKNDAGKALELPLVGGGGKFKVAIGDGGEVIGYQGVWRPIADVVSHEDVMPKAEALERYRKSVGDLKLTRAELSLAYYAAPSYESQTYLAPVWVVQAEADVDGERVPLRHTLMAATQYGPTFPAIQALPRDGDKPLSPSEDGDEGRKVSASWLDLLIPKAHAANGFEAGASWIGPSQGLAGSPANAGGFITGMALAGWAINFNWGEANAWESDWNANDDTWVDAADFVFYTGHANANGWVLNAPGDTFLHFSEVGASPGNPNDRYGQQDLEWAIIAACGPHQSSHFTTSVGNAFDRWRGIFDRMHIFLGYGAVTYDNTTEGARFTQLARSGWPIIDAWFRTAWEIQPATNGFAAPDGPVVYVTAMYAHDGNHSTRNDHIWGFGSVAADPPTSGQSRTLMWSGT